MSDLKFQNTVKNIVFLLAGIVFAGAVIGSLNDSVSFLTPNKTYFLTVFTLIVWVGTFYYLRKKKPVWKSGTTNQRLKKLNRQINLGVLGILIVLWAPFIFGKNEKENDARELAAKTIQSVGRIVKDEALTTRIYEELVNAIILRTTIKKINPEDISIVIHPIENEAIRFDFSNDGMLIQTNGYRPYNSSFPPLMKERIKGEYNAVYSEMDCAWLRKISPSHPFSNLTLKLLNNAAVQILFRKGILKEEENIEDIKSKINFSISINAIVSDYEVELLSASLDSVKSISSFPKEIPEKPDFYSVFYFPEWRLSIKNIREYVLGGLNKKSEYLYEQTFFENWEGLWENGKVLKYFNQNYKVPFDRKSIVFHSWNHSFIRLKDYFEKSSQCEIRGISSFYVPFTDKHSLWASIADNVQNSPEHRFRLAENLNNSVTLTINEIISILNLMRQQGILNQSILTANNGEQIEHLYIILPNRNNYLILSYSMYYEYNIEHPQKLGSDYEQTAINVFKNSLVKIGELPQK